MLQEEVDTAGEFNGAAWRRQSGSDPRPISIIEEAFANTSLPIPPGPTPLWGPGDVPGEWAYVCGVYKTAGVREGVADPNAWCLHDPTTICWASSAQIRAAITKCGCTSSTSKHDWSIVYPRITNLVDRVLRKGNRQMITAKKGNNIDHSRQRYVSPM